jgi:PAS domain S-box-containing protein
MVMSATGAQTPRLARRSGPLHRPAVRYLFAAATVALALGMTLMIVPLTERGAPFVLFLVATLATGLFAGLGPGLLTVLAGVPLATLLFVVPSGYSASQATFQALLYTIAGSVVLYLTRLTNSSRRALERAHDESKQAAMWTRSLIDLAPDAFLLAEPDGRFLDVNETACRMLGYERADLIGKSIFDLIPPEDVPRIAAVRDELTRRGRVHQGQWRLRCKDRTFLPVEVSSNILPGGRWQAFARDISERQRLEQWLRESHDDLNRAQSVAKLGSWRLDLSRNELRWSDESCRIFGVAPGTPMSYEAFLACVHPDDRSFIDEKWKAALHGAPYDVEHRIVVDGTVKWVRAKGDHERDPRDVFRGGVGIVQDITDSKRIQEQLRVSEAKASGIISIAADAIISIDEAQRIVLFNEGAEKMFGYGKRDVMGAPVDVLLPQRFCARHREHVAGFLASQDVARRMGQRLEVLGRRKSGEEFPAEASISKVSLAGGVLLSVVLRDITERKRTEESLRRAVAARDHVLGIVAHDLRNPLGAIMMQSSLLGRPEPEPERRSQKPVEVIRRAALRMNRLIQDLLDVALIEANALRLRRERIRAPELVLEAVDMQRQLAAGANLELAVTLAKDVYEVWADHDRLLEVFENLISNAVKFTDAGGRITIGATGVEDEILFSVADTGSGIAPESVAHVFDPFWQAAERAGRLGAGLGLPITKGIVEAHGGRIWVESAVGRGSTFFFAIPKAAPAGDATAAVVH